MNCVCFGQIIFLLWASVSVCVCVWVTHLCPTLCDHIDCSPPGSSAHSILQARVLEWVAIPFSRGSSRPRDQTQVSRIAGRFHTVWATREAPSSRVTWEWWYLPLWVFWELNRNLSPKSQQGHPPPHHHRTRTLQQQVGGNSTNLTWMSHPGIRHRSDKPGSSRSQVL